MPKREFLVVYTDGSYQCVDHTTVVGAAVSGFDENGISVLAVIDMSLFTDEGMGDAFFELQRRFAE